MPQYNFKLVQEFVWVAVVAAVTALGAELLTFNDTVLDDPAAWGLAVLGAVARAAVAAVVARFNGSFAVR